MFKIQSLIVCKTISFYKFNMFWNKYPFCDRLEEKYIININIILYCNILKLNLQSWKNDMIYKEKEYLCFRIMLVHTHNSIIEIWNLEKRNLGYDSHLVSSDLFYSINLRQTRHMLKECANWFKYQDKDFFAVK
jgi:hypothetical protein